MPEETVPNVDLFMRGYALCRTCAVADMFTIRLDSYVGIRLVTRFVSSQMRDV